MRYLSKLCSLDSVLAQKFHYFQDFKLQKFRLSIHSKSSSLHSHVKIQETRTRKPQKEANDIGPLFNEIKEIVGAENLTVRKNPSGNSVSQETHIRHSKITEDYPHGIQLVCGIADEGIRLENAATQILEDNQSGNPGVDDVSPIVHKITEIVRAENDVISMEERLDNSGFQFDPEIVEKVLKRCFKVRHLALRFFNWVKHRAGFRHTTGTCNTMIYIAGEAKEFDLVEKLVEEMEKSQCPKDIKTWTILISHFGKAKLIGKALLVFEKMKKSGCETDATAYKLIISALCAAKKPDIAMEFYKEIVSKGMVVDMALYEQLLDCLCGSGDISAVRLVGDDMMKISEVPEYRVYACMLKSFCISGRIREALELIHELKNKKTMLDTESLEILVKGLCRANRIVDALEITDILKKNHIVDGKVYGIIINGYLRRGEISKALELFSSIKESGHLPTVSTYTELMQHLFRSNEYQRACELYEEMFTNGVEPDAVAIMAVVTGHVRHNHLFEAWELFKSMKEKGIKITQKSYSLFIKELCRISKTDEAFKLLNEMWDSKINTANGLYHLVISCLEKKGETEKVEKVKQMWKSTKLCTQNGESAEFPSGGSNTNCDVHKSVKFYQNVNVNQFQTQSADVQLVHSLPVAYNDHDLQEICGILSSSMDWCSMQESLENCTVQFTPELVVEILRNCQRHGYAALQFFTWVGQRPGYSHTTETYNMSIKISGSAKDFKHMRKLYLEMKRRCCLITSDTWTIMIMQYGRVGLTEIALEKFKEMKAGGCHPNGSTYKYLIISLCGRKGRKVDEAVKIFDEMIRAGFMPDKELVEIYLDCLCEVGKVSDAKRCTESVCEGGFTIPVGYSLFIRALCRAGRLKEALALVDEMGEARFTLDQHIYGSLVHGLLREGRLGDALAKVEAMKQVGIYPTVHVYTSFIVHFFKEKQIGKALEIFKEMVREGCEPTVVTYSALIRGYMNMGMVFDAWNVFHQITLKGPFPDFKTYSMFITCLCNISRSEEALQLIYEMLDKGIFPSTVNFRTVFYGLNREGKQDLAHTVLKAKWALMSKRKFLT